MHRVSSSSAAAAPCLRCASLLVRHWHRHGHGHPTCRALGTGLEMPDGGTKPKTAVASGAWRVAGSEGEAATLARGSLGQAHTDTMWTTKKLMKMSTAAHAQALPKRSSTRTTTPQAMLRGMASAGLSAPCGLGSVRFAHEQSIADASRALALDSHKPSSVDLDPKRTSDAMGEGEASTRSSLGGEATSLLSTRSSRSRPVSAYYVSRHIDLRSLSESRLFCKLPQSFQRDCLVINLALLTNPKPGTATTQAQTQTHSNSYSHSQSAGSSIAFLQRRRKLSSASAGASSDSDGAAASSTPPSFLVAFRYGAVVFFNVPSEVLKQRLLRATRQYSGSTPFSTPHTEDYGVSYDPHLPEWSQLCPEQIRLRDGDDINNVTVISSVLGQSVALDHYNAKADRMLEEFTQLNQEMEGTGKFTMPRKKLFQLVAENNIVMTDAITKLGLLERSDAAWKYQKYGKIWEDMRNEFELEDRFERLGLKLDLMQSNVKYFLEILQNRKSDTLEWIIILLILGEIILSLYDIYDRTKEKMNTEDKEGSGEDIDLRRDIATTAFPGQSKASSNA